MRIFALFLALWLSAPSTVLAEDSLLDFAGDALFNDPQCAPVYKGSKLISKRKPKVRFGVEDAQLVVTGNNLKIHECRPWQFCTLEIEVIKILKGSEIFEPDPVGSKTLKFYMALAERPNSDPNKTWIIWLLRDNSDKVPSQSSAAMKQMPKYTAPECSHFGMQLSDKAVERLELRLKNGELRLD